MVLRGCVLLKRVQMILWFYYNLDLRSYGYLLPLFLMIFLRFFLKIFDNESSDLMQSMTMDLLGSSRVLTFYGPYKGQSLDPNPGSRMWSQNRDQIWSLIMGHVLHKVRIFYPLNPPNLKSYFKYAFFLFSNFY